MNKLLPVLVFACLALMLVFSWQNVLSYKGQISSEYNRHMSTAEKLEKKKIYIDAVKEYETACNMRPDYELAMKIAGLYKELEDESSYIDACQNAIKIDKSQIEPYRIIADYYIDENNYSKAYDILNQSEEALGHNDELFGKLVYILGKYNTSIPQYDTFSPWVYEEGSKTGYAKISIDGLYGLANSSNQIVCKCENEDIGLFMNNVIPVKRDGEYYYIDSNGYRKLVPDNSAEYLGPFSSDYAPAKINGKYGYLDKNMQELHFEYDYAGCFYNGMAAVQKNSKWAVINTSFKEITGFDFDEILIDDYGFCSLYGVFFAKKDGSYALYNNEGKKISDNFDDVRQFASSQPAAVKKDGKWGFISIDGKMVIEPEYDDAKSFCVNYAPVKIKGKWGCIDKDRNVIIEPAFEQMESFDRNGYALVEIDGEKQFIIITLY